MPKQKTERENCSKLAQGMGRLIRSRPGKPWIWQHWDARDKKWVTTPTKEINRSKAEQFAYQQAAMRNGQPLHSSGVRVLFSAVADDYIAARREGRDCKRLRRPSILKLTGAVRMFMRFLRRGYETLTVDQVDAGVLKGFVEREAERVGTDTANARLHSILQILDFALKHNLIRDVPKVTGVFKPVTDDNGNGVTGSAVPTGGEVRRILEAAKVERTPTDRRTGHGRTVYDGINANDYSDLFIALCFTGMRINEAIHLTWDDVDFQNKVILVRPGNKNGVHWQPKTKHGIRRIAIVPELDALLCRVKGTNRKNRWVFETKRGTRLYDCNVQKRFRELCDGLEFEKRFTVHSLRKYWASTVAQQGMPWQVMIKMFGHGDFKLIMETYYAQNDDARLINEANKIDFGLAAAASDDAGLEGASDE